MSILLLSDWSFLTSRRMLLSDWSFLSGKEPPVTDVMMDDTLADAMDEEFDITDEGV